MVNSFLVLNDFLASGIILIVLFVIFYIGKLVKKISDSEISRKFVHIFASLFSLSFPFLIKNSSTLLILSIFFALVISIMKFKKDKDNFLKSVVDIDRATVGEILFPITIYLLFIFSDKYYFYFISVLVLSFSDALAAIIGKKYGVIKIPVEQDYKSLEGSITFFFITFLIIEIPLLLMTNLTPLQCILISLIISLLITMLELISVYGTDNILVPLGVLFLIQRLSKVDLDYLFYLTLSLIVISFITFVIFGNFKVIGLSGIIGMILVNYTCLTLTNLKYFIILLYFGILFLIVALIRKLNYRYDITEILQTTFWCIIISFFIHFNYHLVDKLIGVFLCCIAWQSLFIFNFLYNKNLNFFQKMLNLALFLVITIIPVFIVFNLNSYLIPFIIISIILLIFNSIIDEIYLKISLEKYRFIMRNILILIGIISLFVFNNKFS